MIIFDFFLSNAIEVYEVYDELYKKEAQVWANIQKARKPKVNTERLNFSETEVEEEKTFKEEEKRNSD